MPNGVGVVAECCTPAGCLSQAAGGGVDVVNDLEAVRVLCNNEQCIASGLMHRQCFDHWEASILHYLRSCGRARNWSERQRCQNLWTKKGYDLAFKVYSIQSLWIQCVMSRTMFIVSISDCRISCRCRRRWRDKSGTRQQWNIPLPPVTLKRKIRPGCLFILISSIWNRPAGACADAVIYAKIQNGQ